MQSSDAFDPVEAKIRVQECPAIEDLGFLHDLTENLITDVGERLQLVEVCESIVLARKRVAQIELVAAVVRLELDLELLLLVDHHVRVGDVVEVEHWNAFVSAGRK